MINPHDLLPTLAAVLGCAALTTLLCGWLRQPVVLGYLLAGMLVGPYIPIPVSADQGTVHTLAELGVIFLMFSLGLELRVSKLLRLAGSAGLVALLEMSLLFFLGYRAGQVLGWGRDGSLFTGGVVAISSTMIIARALSASQASAAFRERVFGVLIFEDLGAILLLAALGTLSQSAGGTGGGFGSTAGRLLLFLVAAVVLGRIVIPRIIHLTLRLRSDETLLVVAGGLCFGGALLAQTLGFSVALGAFLAGLLCAESGEGEAIEHLLAPLRDLFTAVFFVSVGMLIDPQALWQHRVAVLLLSGIVIVGKIVGVAAGSFLTGAGVRTALLTGFTFAQVGEFSFIIAGLGQAGGTAPRALYPVAVGVSVLTTLLSPLLNRVARPVAAFIDRRLPPSLQTVVTLYGAWLERLRTAPDGAGRRRRRLLLRVALDCGALIGLIIGATVLDARATALLSALGLSPLLSRVALIVGTIGLAVPLCIGLSRTTQRLGDLFATQVIPLPPPGTADLGRAPRRALSLMLQIGALVLCGLPALALTQPFLSDHPLLLQLGLIVLLLGALLGLLLRLLRGGADLAGHVRAGVEVVFEALGALQPAEPTARTEAPALPALPGLPGVETGPPTLVTIAAGTAAAGRSLAQLDLRALTGATALALIQEGAAPQAPSPQQPLQAGDRLMLVGSEEALAHARQLLDAPAGPT